MTGIDPSPGEAAAALAGIDQSAAAVRGQTRWAVRVLTAYGVATLIFFPASGLLPGVPGNVAWVVFLGVLLCYVLPRRVLGRGFRRLYFTATAVWTALWVALALLGRLVLPGVVAYWAAAGVVVALPMLIAARRARA